MGRGVTPRGPNSWSSSKNSVKRVLVPGDPGLDAPPMPLHGQAQRTSETSLTAA
jgi:hypothetical protein